MNNRHTGIVLSSLSLALSLSFARSVHALPLPDSSSCNSATNDGCLKIANTNSVTGSSIAITGEGGVIGVRGVSTTGMGVQGHSQSGMGVYGASTNGAGISGYSTNYDAIVGTVGSSSSSAGVVGKGGAVGVYGEVPAGGTGKAVFGHTNNSSTAWAGYFGGRVSATSYVTSSDARLKKDIENLVYGTNTLSKLRPVTYLWKDGDSNQRRQIGLIAQEVQNIIPELVDSDAKSGILSVNYQALVPVLIKTLQEQQATIRTQGSQIAALERMQPPTLSSNMTALALGLVTLGLIAAWRLRRES